MKSLYLHIKHGVNADINTVMLFDILCKTQLVLTLYCHELILRTRILCKTLQRADNCKIRDPPVAYLVCDPVCKLWICMEEEPSLGDAVGLVVKFFRPHLIELSELLCLKDVGVKSCNAID